MNSTKLIFNKDEPMRAIDKKINTIKVYLISLWSKKGYFFFTSFFIAFIGWSLVSLLPNKYETKARIYADTFSILKPLLNGLAVQGDAKEEIRMISRTLLSQSVREEIAKKSDLYLQYPEPDEFNELIEELKDEIKITRSSGNDIYDISYKNKNPQMAMEVVQLTMNKFVDASAGNSRDDALTARDFLKTQITMFEDKLLDSESKLAKYKQENQLLLPGNGGSYHQSMINIDKKIESLNHSISEVEAQLSGSKKRFLNAHSNKKESGYIPTPYDDRLERLREALDSLMVRYTEKHPTIIEIKQTILELEKLQGKSRRESIKQATSGALATSKNNEESDSLGNFSSFVASLESEKDLLLAQLKNTKAKRASLASKINLIPEVEAELVELNRDYQNNLKFYESLVNRKISAEISRDADKDTKNVKFRVIEEPKVAIKPVGPPRSVLYVLVWLFSIAAGASLSLLVSQINPTIVNRHHLDSIIKGDRVIGSIQNAHGSKIKRTASWVKCLFTIYLILLMSTLILLIAHEFVLGQSLVIWLPKLGISL